MENAWVIWVIVHVSPPPILQIWIRRIWETTWVPWHCRVWWCSQSICPSIAQVPTAGSSDSCATTRQSMRTYFTLGPLWSLQGAETEVTYLRKKLVGGTWHDTQLLASKNLCLKLIMFIMLSKAREETDPSKGNKRVHLVLSQIGSRNGPSIHMLSPLGRRIERNKEIQGVKAGLGRAVVHSVFVVAQATWGFQSGDKPNLHPEAAESESIHSH